MELIKQWIEEIRAKSEEYATGCWTCRVTADTVEFRINDSVIFNKDKFKHTVIKIGMILTRISRLLEEENKAFHIQTFPHLEDLRIVALIRFHVNLSQGKGFVQHQSISPETGDQSIIKFAEKRANQLNFDLLCVEKNNLSAGFQIEKKWYLLCSNHDNPFTWLNIGYLTEELLLRSKDFNSQYAPQILTGLTLLKITEIPVLKNPPQFVHAYIGF